MGTTKQINIKNRTYYFYNDIIDLENFDSSLFKLDENHTRTLVFTVLDILPLKKLVIVKIFNFQFSYIFTYYPCKWIY